MTLEALEERAPARPDEVAGLRHAVQAFAQAHGADDRKVGDIALAVGEACGNAVLHAYRDGREGDLVVRAWVRDAVLHLEIVDRGLGMAPRHDSTGLGLGLPLMSTLADQLSVSAGADGAGTTVRMTFALEG